jgi:hypothetical protein
MNTLWKSKISYLKNIGLSDEDLIFNGQLAQWEKTALRAKGNK